MEAIGMLDELQKKALRDELLRRQLLDTRLQRDPLREFCRICQMQGYELYPMDVIAAGEDFYAAMRRSTNGGGENSPLLDGEDDFYELFFGGAGRIKEERKKMNPVYEKLMKCYESFKAQVDFRPEVALVLGSGLGDYGKTIEVVAELDYGKIEGFPVSTAEGHVGRYLFGYIKGVPVVCMQGRVHYYEGYSISDVVLPIRLMKLMGAKVLFLTNASGGVNFDFHPGDLMLVQDHISLVPSPLIGPNLDGLGDRFPDMSAVYDKELQDVLRKVAVDEGIALQEGVYVQFTGPQFETPAEVRMARVMGGDAVGMSTACEAVAAHHMGMRICAVSCVVCMASGVEDVPLSHEEVQKAGERVIPVFRKLVTEGIAAIAKSL